ncbi:MAG: hypothetical protein PHR28_12790 [candidate division Zixibacteria bacterium]|nr:hypothetical protein [candidate division Zixibacteria bacterium]
MREICEKKVTSQGKQNKQIRIVGGRGVAKRATNVNGQFDKITGVRL